MKLKLAPRALLAFSFCVFVFFFFFFPLTMQSTLDLPRKLFSHSTVYKMVQKQSNLKK